MNVIHDTLLGWTYAWEPEQNGYWMVCIVQFYR